MGLISRVSSRTYRQGYTQKWSSEFSIDADWHGTPPPTSAWLARHQAANLSSFTLESAEALPSVATLARNCRELRPLAQPSFSQADALDDRRLLTVLMVAASAPRPSSDESHEPSSS